jgi:histidinol-phosphate aminotransferase
MSHAYERVPEYGEGLRLHLNENTGGCSPRVIEALRQLTCEDAAYYPDYSEAHARCAKYLGVSTDRVLLVNGLDEGIHAVSLAYLQRGPDGAQREAVIVEPAFDMYAACAAVASARCVEVPPRPDFVFPADEAIEALTADTRVVFLTSPNNPTGIAISRDDVARVASALPPEAVVLLDEAYVDFARASFLDVLAQWPNVILGRTFAKAQGLAAVRAGCLVGDAPAIERLRAFVLPYSINVYARTAIVAALDDRDHLAWYRGQVAASRQLVYAMCDRLGLTCWPSEANFVLVRVGAGASALVAALATRRIFIRDRSTQPGCAGCVRITTGVVDHTRRAITEIEDLLCAAR